MSISVMRRSGTRGMLTVDMGIDIQDTTLRRRAQSSEPRLRDAIRTALSDYSYRYYRPSSAPDPVMISRLITQEVDRTLGGPGAHVLLVNVIYQPRS